MGATDLSYELRPILLRALERCDSTSNSHDLIANEALAEIEDTLRPTLDAAADLLTTLKALMPGNLGALPATMPDSTTLPLDVSFGELRRARAAIAKARGEA